MATTLRRIERLGRAEPRAEREHGGASVHRAMARPDQRRHPFGPARDEQDRDDGRQPER